MRRALGVVLVLVFGALAAFSVMVGVTLGGWDPPSSQCSQSTPPDRGGPFYENTRVQGYRTFLPLGTVCTYDVDGDAFGPQSVAHQNWPATITCAASLALVVTGFVMLVRGKRR